MNGRIDGRCFCRTATGSCFWAGNFSKDGARSGIYLSSLSERQKDFLVEARSNPGFAQNGYLFYVDEKGRLGMQAFDPDTGHVTGDLPGDRRAQSAFNLPYIAERSPSLPVARS